MRSFSIFPNYAFPSLSYPPLSDPPPSPTIQIYTLYFPLVKGFFGMSWFFKWVNTEYTDLIEEMEIVEQD